MKNNLLRVLLIAIFTMIQASFADYGGPRHPGYRPAPHHPGYRPAPYRPGYRPAPYRPGYRGRWLATDLPLWRSPHNRQSSRL